MDTPSPTDITAGVLQVTDRSKSIDSLLWVLTIADLDLTNNFYHQQGFDIRDIPTTQDTWVNRYRLARSLAYLPTEATSTTPTKGIL